MRRSRRKTTMESERGTGPTRIDRADEVAGRGLQCPPAPPRYWCASGGSGGTWVNNNDDERKTTMTKYYRVKKDTFLWKAGAVLEKKTFTNGCTGYQPIEDVWNVVEVTSGSGKDEYISSPFIEAKENEEWFERVYKDDVAGKLWKTKDQLVAAYNEAFAK